MNDKTLKRIDFIINICTLAIMVIVFVLILMQSSDEIFPRVNYKKAKKYAIELINNGLYQQAADEFEDILEKYRLSDKEAGAIIYQIGDIYAEHIGNSQKALAAYTKLKQLYPDHPLVDDTERKIITQLDRSGQSKKAQRYLEKSVQLGTPVSEADPNEILAQIGNRAIAQSEIEDAMTALPPELSRQMNNKNSILQFLKSYIGQQLMYDAALREGYDQKNEIQRDIQEAQKAVIVQAYWEDKIANKVNVNTTDIEIYYEKNKNQFSGKSLEEIRDQVKHMVIQEKTAGLQNDLIEKMIESEEVKLYPENIQID